MRLPRFIFILVGLGAILASVTTLRASDALPEPATGRSARVTQPHVTAELLTETTTLQVGKPFDVVLHLHMDDNWHTYWINPGDAGLATVIKWTLPPGIQSAGPIEWPTPELHAMGPLTTYGYGGDVYLPTRITPIAARGGELPRRIEIKAHVTWLVCQEECIPGKADLAVTLDTAHLTKTPAPASAREAFFQAVRARLPIPDTRWNVTASYASEATPAAQPTVLNLTFEDKTPGAAPLPQDIRFFPEQANVLATDNKSQGAVTGNEQAGYHLAIHLAQNGEKPDHLGGVLVSSQPLQGDAKAVHFTSFPVGTETGGASAAAASANSSPASSTSSTPVAASNPATPSSPLAAHPASSPAAAAPGLIAVLVFAFLGGLILNLMPCVLPVLSLKVFSLIKHAGENSGGAWKQGVAFTAGVVISFWVLAGLLIALEAAGSHLGWGFQMQSPGFVLALIFLFFLLGLNLFGVFELGTSLVGLDAKAASHLSGLLSSFANGALAALAATPCTAPFMGSAVGFAAQQPAAISLLVFTSLALGMAAPYLALTAFPGALRLVPRPGAWMETLRQFMGFLLMGTVIFLVYVFGALVGGDDVPMLLGVLLLAALAAWIFGCGTPPVRAFATRFISAVLAVLLLGTALVAGARLTDDVPPTASATAQDGWQPYSPEAVQAALKQGHPAFVDFTAAWCLSCKVNERIALDIDSTKKLFAQKHVALFRGDWTHSDPQITTTLREFNRDGVPLYLLYSPGNAPTPQVLPEVLTPGIVAGRVAKGPVKSKIVLL